MLADHLRAGGIDVRTCSGGSHYLIGYHSIGKVYAEAVEAASPS